MACIKVCVSEFLMLLALTGQCASTCRDWALKKKKSSCLITAALLLMGFARAILKLLKVVSRKGEETEERIF